MGRCPEQGAISPQAWQLQLALGACRAGRLLAAASLAGALFALHRLTGTAGLPASVFASLAALAVLPAYYLAARLEIDRGLFQRLADAQDGNGNDLAALDRALVELGWRAEEGATRPLAARVAGTARLMKGLAGVVAGQWLALVLSAWVP